MRGLRIPRVLVSALISTLLVAGLCGGSCFVAYCSEDCDPCVQQCKCHDHCQNGLSYDYETAHRLADYRLVVAREADGTVLRNFAEIVGLSLDFAHGPVEHTQADAARFAEAMIDVNPWLLAPGGRRWVAEPVQRFEESFVVPFRGEDAREGLEFLFDRRGGLVEIHQALRP